MKSTFEIPVPSDTKWCMSRIYDLLFSEALILEKATETKVSFRSPLVIFGWDRRNYSRKNWTGFNPFIWISNIDIEFKSDQNIALITIDRRRIINVLIACIFVECLILLATPFSVALLVGVALLLVGSLILFGSKSLIKNEIAHELHSHNSLSKCESE